MFEFFRESYLLKYQLLFWRCIVGYFRGEDMSIVPERNRGCDCQSILHRYVSLVSDSQVTLYSRHFNTR